MKQISSWLFWLIVICFVGLVAYANTFTVPFAFDDLIQIVGNRAVYTFDVSELWRQFSPRIVVYFTLAANYAIGQLSVVGYHVFNLAIHLVTAGLVFWLIDLLARQTGLRKHGRLVAGLAALLFVSHPIQTQAVTYIVQRLAVMAAMFYVLGLVLYVLARRRGGWNWLHGASFLAILLAMFSKEIAFTAPFAIVMIEFFFFADARRDGVSSTPGAGQTGASLTPGVDGKTPGVLPAPVKATLPYLLLLLVIPLTLWFNQPAIVERTPRTPPPDQPLPYRVSRPLTAETISVSRGQYLLTQFNVVRTYLRLMVWPVNQNLDYDYPLANSLRDPKTLASLGLIVGIMGLGWWLYRRERLMSFGIFFFFLALSVESSIFPIRDVIFEHRLYLPSVGLAMVVAGGLGYLLRRYRQYQGQVVMGVLLIVIVLAGATFQRNKVWASAITLWQDVIAKSPQEARGYNNLGTAYVETGRLDLAAKQFRQAVNVDANYAEGYNNMGLLEILQGNVEDAIPLITKAIELEPAYTHAVNNLGVAYFKQGEIELAAQEFAKAVRLDSRYLDAIVNLGVAYTELGKIGQAERQFEKALELDPSHEKARVGRLGLERLRRQR